MKFNVAFVISIILASFSLNAQPNDQDTKKRTNFGFSLGLNFPKLNIEEVTNLDLQQKNEAGLRFGILMDYKVANHLHFSPKAELSFNSSSVEIPSSNSTSSFSSYYIFPLSLELMTHAIIKGGKGSLKPYLLCGPNYRISLKDRSLPSLTFRNRNDLAIDLGIGLEKVFTHLKIAPEIRYSRGLFDVNLNPTLKSVKYNTISLVFNFKS